MNFADRESAARLLLGKLKKYKGQNPLVLGIPRGAMPMAKVIARGLGGELGAVLVHKIPYPGGEEFAVGCVGISGHVHSMPYAHDFKVPEEYMRKTAEAQLEVLKKRKADFGIGEYDYENRTVIIVDDGIATGATTICAIHEVRSRHPGKVVLACAVAPPGTARKLRPMVDEFVVLDEPETFYAVGQFFDHFPQVSDEQVVEILREAGRFKREA